MEILLIIWSAGLAIWTIWLFVVTAVWHKEAAKLYADKMRWVTRCEAARRENIWKNV